MSDIGYHWAPASRRAAITTEGLKIGCLPAVNGVEDDHRNPWISLSPTPAQAWTLSAGALAIGGFPSESPAWDLWQANLTGLDLRHCGEHYPELRALQPVPPAHLTWIASRPFLAASTEDQTRPRGVSPEIRCHSDEMRRHSDIPLLHRIFGPALRIAAAQRLHPAAR